MADTHEIPVPPDGPKPPMSGLQAMREALALTLAIGKIDQDAANAMVQHYGAAEFQQVSVGFASLVLRFRPYIEKGAGKPLEEVLQELGLALAMEGE
jgi:hypothetical protein